MTLERDSLTDLTLLDVRAQQAGVVDWQGQAALRLESGLVLLPFARQDFSAEVWIGAEGPCYPGIAFRAAGDQDYEAAYVAPHVSGQWDAIQYDAAFHGSMTWQIYHGPAYQAAAAIPLNRWFRLRIDAAGERLTVAVDNQPPLIVPRLAHPVRAGALGLWTYLPAYFRDFAVWDDPAIPPGGVPPAAPPDALDAWLLEGVGRVAVEPNGTLNLNRWLPVAAGEARLSRHFALAEAGRVRLAFGFSDRLALSVDGREVFQGECRFTGMDSYAGRGYVEPGAYQVELDLPAGEHTLSAVLGVSEGFGGGIALSAPEAVRWLG